MTVLRWRSDLGFPCLCDKCLTDPALCQLLLSRFPAKQDNFMSGMLTLPLLGPSSLFAGDLGEHSKSGLHSC